LLVEFFGKGTTMKGAFYAEILAKLRVVIQEQRTHVKKDGVFLIHDSAPSHTSKISNSVINELRSIELNHPPYNPDLTLFDYFLFPNLKKGLRNRSFDSNWEVENATLTWIRNKPKSLYSDGVSRSRLQHRREKCVQTLTLTTSKIFFTVWTAQYWD
jgi:hypothetical protein